MKPIVIKAAPRSATLYMTKLLDNSGYNVGHNYWRSGGIVGWSVTPTYLDKDHYIIGHMVRHPLRSIESLVALESSFQYLSDFTGISVYRFCELNLDTLARAWMLWSP